MRHLLALVLSVQKKVFLNTQHNHSHPKLGVHLRRSCCEYALSQDFFFIYIYIYTHRFFSPIYSFPTLVWFEETLENLGSSFLFLIEFFWWRLLDESNSVEPAPCFTFLFCLKIPRELCLNAAETMSFISSEFSVYREDLWCPMCKNLCKWKKKKKETWL